MRAAMALVSALAATVLATPAFAITRQRSPVPSNGQQARIADPDERREELANRTERAAKRHAYDRTNARSVMEIGSPLVTGR